MDFDGPDPRDYENVAALNAAYLELLRRDEAICRGLRGCAAPLGQRLCRLTPQQAARLAATPFLLFSFREQDDLYWSRILEEGRVHGLFRSPGPGDADTLITAALAFIWQLAKQNPYALRLICGASLYWCDRLAELNLYELLDAYRSTGDVPALRLAEREALWRHLLDKGVSRRKEAAQAAQLAALQLLLTGNSQVHSGENWAIAARNVRSPGLRVAEIRQERKSRPG